MCWICLVSSQVRKQLPKVTGLIANVDLGFLLKLVAVSDYGIEQSEVVALVGQQQVNRHRTLQIRFPHQGWLHGVVLQPEKPLGHACGLGREIDDKHRVTGIDQFTRQTLAKFAVADDDVMAI